MSFGGSPNTMSSSALGNIDKKAAWLTDIRPDAKPSSKTPHSTINGFFPCRKL
jgi:hypothetical protein